MMQDEIKKKNKLDPEELKKELEQCHKQKGDYLAGWQRARADFLNYRKEEIKRVGEILKYANLDLILKILPILDNFELAERKILEDLKVDELRSSSPFAGARVVDESFASSSPFAGARVNDESVKGVLQIKNQVLDFLKNQGIEEIKAVGEKFDPNFHEVVEEVERKDKESGIVAEEIQKGYKLYGRVIRPARVRVTR